jgi:hypothetical protein
MDGKREYNMSFKIDNMGYENSKKQSLARIECEKLRNDKNKHDVNFYGYSFQVNEPWYCGGSIDSNCKELYNQDLSIISEFDTNKLTLVMSDLKYLQELCQKRLNDITVNKDVYSISIDRHKDGNKKLVSISIYSHTKYMDGYGDESFKNEKEVEHFTFSDTKQYQQDIEDKILELKNIYNITR